MDQQTKDDIITSGADRAGFYSFLAGVYLWEPTSEQIEAMAAANFPVGEDAFGHGYALIADYLRHRDTGTPGDRRGLCAHILGSWQLRQAHGAAL